MYHINFLPSQDLHGKDTGIEVTCKTALCMQALSAQSSEGEETNSVAHAADEDKMAVSIASLLTSTDRLLLQDCHYNRILFRYRLYNRPDS